MSADGRGLPVGWSAGVARHVLTETDSTNAEAARIGASLDLPAWIFAHRQTAARGRRGRAWVAPEGNFGATLVMRPTGGASGAAQRSFVAALALADALAGVCGPKAAITLKWPNDVLLNGGKVAGILLESSGQGGTVDRLAIGIGVNLIAAPPADAVEAGAVRPVSVLGEAGVRIGAEAFLTPLAAAFAAWEARLQREGFAPVRAAWLDRAARLGETIVAKVGAEVIEGRFETLAADGALVLDLGRDRRVIAAADVYF